jgi:hypothetical protein
MTVNVKLRNGKERQRERERERERERNRSRGFVSRNSSFPKHGES